MSAIYIVSIIAYGVLWLSKTCLILWTHFCQTSGFHYMLNAYVSVISSIIYIIACETRSKMQMGFNSIKVKGQDLKVYKPIIIIYKQFEWQITQHAAIRYGILQNAE